MFSDSYSAAAEADALSWAIIVLMMMAGLAMAAAGLLIAATAPS